MPFLLRNGKLNTKKVNPKHFSKLHQETQPVVCSPMFGSLGNGSSAAHHVWKEVSWHQAAPEKKQTCITKKKKNSPYIRRFGANPIWATHGDYNRWKRFQDEDFRGKKHLARDSHLVGVAI